MKFIVDAQLPLKLAVALNSAGHDAVHTLNLPDKNRSSDTFITRLADSDARIVISKDADFVTSHMVNRSPLRLLQIYREFAKLSFAAADFEQSGPY